MHKVAMEMGKWAMEKAKAHGFDNLNSQDWDDLKDCMEAVKCAICADKDYREVEAMDEAEQEEKLFGRMGYRGRASNGRFVHRSGRGRSAGYTPYPYLHMMEDGMDDYDMYDDIPYPMTGYRMGYPDRYNDGRNSSEQNYSENRRNMGYTPERNRSRYGDAYDRYDSYRRHYTESKDPESKKMMEQSMTEIFGDMENMVENIMKYADASEKPALKQKMVQMAQKVQSMQ